MAKGDKTFVIDLAAHNVPQFKEERSKDWIMYGVEKPYKNLYPEYLLELFNSSAKHHAIVKGKVDYIVGNGIAIREEGLNTENVARLHQLLKAPNGKEDLDTLLYKMTLDLEIFGGFALEIIGNQTHEKIAAIYHADFCKYRKAKDSDGYFYSEEWNKTQPEVEYIPAFDPNKVGGKSLLYVKSYHPQSQAYPLPGYLGCVPYIEMDKEIANFHLNSIKNGFMGGTMINFFNGQPTEEEQRAIERKLYDKFAGSDNANKLVLNFNDSKEQGAEIIALNGNDFDKRFDVLNDTVQQEVFSGHRITDPQLFGINQEGIFASRNQLRDAYELFQNTYVNGRQLFLEEVLNGLAEVQGFQGRLYIKPTEPLGVGFSEATRASVMTEDEIRLEMGLEVVTKEGEESADSKTLDAQAALKGSVGGVSGIITLLQNVNTGIINSDSAIAVLVELYGFTPEVARATVTGEVIPTQVAQEMREVLQNGDLDIKLCEHFSQTGYDLDKWEVVGEGREVRFNSDKELEANESRLKRFGFTSEAFDFAVLEILKKDPTATWASIAAQLETTIDEVTVAIQKLTQANYMTIGTDAIADSTQRSVEVTPQGNAALETAEPLEVTFKVAYRYVKSGEAAGADVIPTTRDFCKTMVNKSKSRVWDSAQIAQVGMKENRNVWLRRGGFWTRKGTSTTTPYCRHVWEQVVIKEKG
jgi:DNA-binding MarR family transcriptional regulator